MSEKLIKQLVDRYIAVSYSVNVKAETLVKEQMGDDLTSDQYYVLRYVNEVGPCTSSHLADVFEVRKSAITAMVQRLWEKGLVERTRDKDDRRVVYLTLTVSGDELFQKIEKRIHQLVATFITRFDRAEITQFIETYEKLGQLLTEIQEDRLGEES